MKITSRNSIIAIIVLFCITIITLLLQPTKECASDNDKECTETEEEKIEQPVLKFGLPINNYTINYDTIRPNLTLATVLYGFGFTSKQIYELTQCPDSIFDARRIDFINMSGSKSSS